MIRQLPIIPTILVVAAAATMVALGFWQLGRAEEKAQLIMMYSKSTAIAEEAVFPMAGDGADLWFRRSSVECVDVTQVEPVSGTAENGAKGWAFRADCVVSGDAVVLVDLGFSRDLIDVNWEGGPVTGMIAPGPRLVADPPLAELRPLAKPDPKDLPNNHLAYAGQWFFFALTALIIYWFAVRSRLTRKD